MSKKIIFFKLGDFSHINPAVAEQLKVNFPNSKIEQCDVLQLIDRELATIKNYFFLFIEYGLDIILKKKNYKSWLICTSHIFKRINTLIHQRYRTSDDILFTFQTQSMFDGSLNNIPHFVYTDSTVKANFEYQHLDPRTFLKSKKWMQLERSVYENATVNFVFSKNQERSVVEDYQIDSNKVVCIYAGANSTVIEDNKTAEQNELNVLFVGVNWERKGGPQLWSAIQKIKQNIHLTVVGCDPKIASDNITILGRVPLKKVDEEFAKASIFCVPTLQEPFGIVFIEAMQRKLPIISCKVGALPDMIKQNVNGILVKPFDEIELQKALEKLLNDKDLRKKMGEEGAKIATRQYTWKNTGLLMAKHINSHIQ